MNCRQTRELVSAYSDQELTGRQMLDISEHLSRCPDCAREWREINEVRRVLRAAFFHAPPSGAEQRLLHRVLAPQEPTWLVLLSAVTGASSAYGAVSGQPPRGRRLATALAFSSLAVLMMAAPFAPQTRDAAGVAGTTLSPSVLSASMFPMPTASWGFAAPPPLRLTPTAPAAAAPVPPQEPDAAEDPGPLRDTTLADYVQSSAAQSSAAWNDAGAVGSR